MDAVETWKTLIPRYESNDSNGAGAPGEILEVKGTGVLLSAPHAVRQLRDGRMKLADDNTGGLAEVVAAATGASLLVPQGRQDGDPNWDAAGDYRTRLLVYAQAGQTVLDLHGMRDDHGCDVCIGRGSAPSEVVQRLAARLVELGESHGFVVSVDAPFSAGGRTLTEAAQRQGGIALELELAKRLRDPVAQPELAAQSLAFLMTAVRVAAE
jgi:hypothetical protein